MLKKKKPENEYIYMTKKEKLINTVKSLMVVLVMDFFFYRSLWGLIMLVPAFLFFRKSGEMDLEAGKRNRIKEQFKELLLLSETGQKAGMSVDNALINSKDDLVVLFGKYQPVVTLVERIIIFRRNNKPIGDVFIDAGEKTGIEDITQFGQIYEIAYEKSGNMSAVMHETANSIIEKLETENEIYLALNDKSFELKVLEMMPFFIMGYIELTNRNYFEMMYGSIFGIGVMSIFVMIYLLVYGWGRKILKIEV